ncbi:hypothetical protein [Mycobacterium sherrisii]|uniref:hypothetical protein n=1 Tax=Mycobacterium sherrisii TaxID=243061 RepID=UPI000A16599A|nr:hypothetical protein [Mycobacterium sherrisii]MCV7030627.1 hypothetical protein [Mycobacterium sherrisii]ORW77279.1 hypothetical protein AWC25_09760 [Mycobacterium sherrisii]
MRISAVLAGFSAFAAIATLPAPSAAAEPLTAVEELKMNGTYRYADEDGDTGTWTIDTTCRQVCVAHVWTGPGQGFNAPLLDGRYIVTRTIPEAAICSNDLSQHPVTVQQSWDPLTLNGVAIFLDSSAPCGLNEAHDTFTLTKLS